METSTSTILVVDDEELVRNLVATIILRAGYSCVTATDGLDALRKIKGEKIEAVVTDVKMPGMDGIFLTREVLKLNPRLPVMVMTAFDEEYSAGTAISCGAREFITKPFSPDEFIIRLHKMIKEAESVRQTEKEKGKNGIVEDFINELEASLLREEDA